MLETMQTGVMQFFTDIAWGQWISSAFLVVLGLFLGSLAARSVGRFMAQRTSRHHTVMVRRLVFYVIVVLFFVAALREAGFSLDVVLGAAGILTVAIGFASQTSASNMISGLFLLVEKPFEIGDFIEVDATIGEVVGIDMLSVKLRTPDNLYVRIPNETLIKTRVPSSVDLQFSYWVPKEKVLEGRSGMMVAIKKTLDREGIEIPFPHTSVYAGSHSEPFRVQLLGPEKITEKDLPDVDKDS